VFALGGQWVLASEGPNAWYSMITRPDLVLRIFLSSYGALLLLLVIGLLIFLSSTLNYKLVMCS